MWRRYAQIRPLLAMGSDDNILALLPFFHICGMTVLLNAALHAHATLVVMQRFDLDEFLKTIEKHRIVFGRRSTTLRDRRAISTIRALADPRRQSR
jgi:acyl-CoA synthetase (AMP-forming)/AMP-acid ligase II